MGKAIEKILTLDELKKKLDEEREAGRTIAWTNGCFDVIHVGHVRYLQDARACADVLVVGINSDDSVRQLKGPLRPLQEERDRAEIIASLESVNYVLIFGEKRVDRYLRELRPNVFVKGGDYTLDKLDRGERDAIESVGGVIQLVKLSQGKSTTDVIDLVRERYSIQK